MKTRAIKTRASTRASTRELNRQSLGTPEQQNEHPLAPTVSFYVRGASALNAYRQGPHVLRGNHGVDLVAEIQLRKTKTPRTLDMYAAKLYDPTTPLGAFLTSHAVQYRRVPDMQLLDLRTPILRDMRIEMIMDPHILNQREQKMREAIRTMYSAKPFGNRPLNSRAEIQVTHGPFRSPRATIAEYGLEHASFCPSLQDYVTGYWFPRYAKKSTSFIVRAVMNGFPSAFVCGHFIKKTPTSKTLEGGQCSIDVVCGQHTNSALRADNGTINAMRAAEELARGEGATCILLQALDDAVGFYVKLGYRRPSNAQKMLNVNPHFLKFATNSEKAQMAKLGGTFISNVKNVQGQNMNADRWGPTGLVLLVKTL